MAETKAGHFVWHELMTTDPKAALEFYPAVCGWKTQPFNDDYTMWVDSQGPIGGAMRLPEQAAKMGAPPHWLGDVRVEDVDATAALAVKLGGKIHVSPADIPSVGRYAVLEDPQGAAIAVFKPSGAMERHDEHAEGEFSWNELVTTDQRAAYAYYSELFGWQKLDEAGLGPMGTYLVYGIGERRLGGIMNVTKEMPQKAFWCFYAQTRDLEGAIARAKRRGAKVVNGPMEVPGGDRIAQLTDPQGALFALTESPRAH